jgi:hypothetical protein
MDNLNAVRLDEIGRPQMFGVSVPDRRFKYRFHAEGPGPTLGLWLWLKTPLPAGSGMVNVIFH